MSLARSFFSFSLLFYYVGLALLLGTSMRAWMIARWDEARGYRIFELVLALMYITPGLGVGCMSALRGSSWLVIRPTRDLRG